MQELEKILYELEKRIFTAEVYNDDFDGTTITNLICLGDVRDILEKHIDDGWIPVEERLPEVCRKIEEDHECPEYNVTIQGAEKATTLKYSPADETWLMIWDIYIQLLLGNLFQRYITQKGAITMTENEAIKIATHCLGVQAEQEVCEECPVYRESGIVCKEIARTVITALKEIQRYCEIGTVEECREAVEKQRTKKPKELDTEYRYFICGNCGGAIAYTDDFKSHKYCLNCGQAIQWDENLEGMRDE